MFMACGVAAYSGRHLHLMTQRLLQGAAVLSAGSVIHALGGEQEMRPQAVYANTSRGHSASWLSAQRNRGYPALRRFFSKGRDLWKASRVHQRWIFWAIGLITA